MTDFRTGFHILRLQPRPWERGWPRLVKYGSSHIPAAWKRYTFRAEPSRIGHYRKYPLGPSIARSNLFVSLYPWQRNYALSWVGERYCISSLKTSQRGDIQRIPVYAFHLDFRLWFCNKYDQKSYAGDVLWFVRLLLSPDPQRRAIRR